jgi:putative flippase GtrA
MGSRRATGRSGLINWLLTTWLRLWREAAKFGVVGLAGLVVDLGLFNGLRYLGGEGPLYDKPLTAKALSVIAATMVTFMGNRQWAFRHRSQRGIRSGYLLFFALNGVAMAIALVCLWFSHYILGFTSPLADNISANVIGLGLGTIFRFWSYRRWVFPKPSTDVRDVPGDDTHTLPIDVNHERT